ncbi:MAG: hypothetical protein GY708_22525 [Actinomycetia bacterium]|nr:hypothetical protein [Actinomycetes bacterium]
MVVLLRQVSNQLGEVLRMSTQAEQHRKPVNLVHGVSVDIRTESTVAHPWATITAGLELGRMAPELGIQIILFAPALRASSRNAVAAESDKPLIARIGLLSFLAPSPAFRGVEAQAVPAHVFKVRVLKQMSPGGRTFATYGTDGLWSFFQRHEVDPFMALGSART